MVGDIAWSDDGRLAAVVVDDAHLPGEPHRVLVADGAGGMVERDVGALEGMGVLAMAWSPDGRLVWATDDGLATMDPSDLAALPTFVSDQALVRRSIYALTRHGGKLWALASGGEVWQLVEGRWRSFGVAEGPGMPMAFQMLGGSDGGLWFLHPWGVDVLHFARQ